MDEARGRDRGHGWRLDKGENGKIKPSGISLLRKLCPCGDYQNLNGGYAFNSNWSSSNANYGPFYLNNNDPSNTNGSLGFSLRK